MGKVETKASIRGGKSPRDSEATGKSDAAEPDVKTVSVTAAREIVNVALRPVPFVWTEIRIKGTDLITHRWSEKALKQMRDSQQMSAEEKRLKKKNREKRDPDGDYEGARYHWDDRDWFPTNGIKKAMVSAGMLLGIPKSVIRATIFVIGERRDYAVIHYGKIVKREDAVRVGPKRDADLRYRPEYQDWHIDLKIKVRTDIMSPEQVVALLQNAGFSIGIGEWRPEKDGQAGTFEPVSMPAKGKRAA